MQSTQPPVDVIDHLLGLTPDDSLYVLRHARDKVVDATQAFHHKAFYAPDLSHEQQWNRWFVAALLAQVTGPAELAGFYRQHLDALAPPADYLALLDGHAADSAALTALAAYAHALAVRPATADRQALLGLVEAGWSVPELVALAQVMGYVSYQARNLIGLKALKEVQNTVGQATPGDEGAEPFVHPAHLPPPGQLLEIQGFTNASLDWQAWLPIQNSSTLTDTQVAILATSHPKAQESDYYMLLIQAPELLEQRSLVYNAIMYAPGGAARAEREVAATTVSRVNGCVYCASVHAQRFEQLAKRNDVIAQIFDQPETAGTSARERAIVQMAIALTREPASFGSAQLQPLLAQGITPEQIRDLIASVAIFAWANRLMLNLGQEVRPA